MNGGNTVGATDSQKESLVRYTAGIPKWTKDEQKVNDRKTRKIITMNRMYHPESDIHELYISRMEGG